MTTEDKIEELSHEAATALEDFYDIANEELIGFDFAGAKGFIAHILRRYQQFLKHHPVDKL